MRALWCCLVLALVALFVNVISTEIVRADRPVAIAAMDSGNTAVSPPVTITTNDQCNYVSGLPSASTIIGSRANVCPAGQPAALLAQRVNVATTEFATASQKDHEATQVSLYIGPTATPSPAISQATNGALPLVILRI